MIPRQTLAYRPDVQGLRAIAIGLVVLAHGQVRAFQGGFVGVDVFFVLSGYLITGLLLTEYQRSNTIDLAGFYARRLKRLLPALAVMLCVVTLIAPVVLSMHEVTEQTASLSYAATWTSNLFFALRNIDYFAELQMRDLFLHTWSLGLEEQFYLIWPVLLLVAVTRPNRASGSGNFRTLMAVLTLLFVCSLVLAWRLTYSQTTWAYYLMPSRIWQFALGAAVFAWRNGRVEVSKALPPSEAYARGQGWLGTAGAVLIVGSAMLIDTRMAYPGFLALFPSLGAAMILIARNTDTSGGVGQILAHPAMVWAGDHAYSWYLWHWPVFMLGFAFGMQSHLGGTTVLAALSLLLAMLSYRWIELPFWKGRFSRIATARVFLLSLLVMLTVIAVSANYLRSMYRSESATETSIYDPRSDLPNIYSQECDSYTRDSDVRPCIIGDPNAPRTAVLIGDSIGTQWVSMLPGLFRGPEWRTVVFTKSSCPMVDEKVFDRSGRPFTRCSEWRNKVLDYLPTLKPRIVFLGSGAVYGFTAAQWIEGSDRVLSRVTRAAPRVVIIPGTPKLSFDGPGCLDRRTNRLAKDFGARVSACRETLTDPRAAEVARYLNESARQFANVRLLNLNDLVCPEGVCAASTTSGQVVFRDSQHLTASFVRSLRPRVEKRLRRLNW